MKSLISFNILVALSLNFAYCQIEINKEIIFTNQEDSLRQIEGISEPIFERDLVNVNIYQNQYLHYGEVQGTDSLYMTLPALNSYTEGLVIHFRNTFENTKSVTININSIGPVPIKKAVTDTLINNELKPGQLYSIIFDGNAFQMISKNTKVCPSGFIEVNQHYCIEQNERPSKNFWNANVACMDEGMRLCTWAEWYYACQKSGLGLIGMTNNYEFVDSAANEQYHSKIVGNGSCVQNTNSDNSISTSYYKFRCCYSLVE